MNIQLTTFALLKSLGSLMETVLLPVSSIVKHLEMCFNSFFKERNGYNKPGVVNIDFTEVQFIEPSSSTTYLIGMINTLVKNGFKFTVTPPRANGVKFVLYTWRFFEVLEEITEIPIAEFAPSLQVDFSEGKNFRISSLREKVLRYYNNVDDEDYKKFFRNRYLDESSIYHLTTTEKFFPLLSLNFSNEELKFEEFENEKNRWDNATLINNVLSNNLKNIDAKRRITDDVVSEAISNAIMHSSANKFFTGSYFDWKDNLNKSKSEIKDKTYNFTLNFWDNGKSILSTLREPLENSVSIKSHFSEETFNKQTNTSFVKFIRTKNGANHTFVDNTTMVIDKHSQPEEIILAAFFPGISSQVYRNNDSSGQQPLAGLGLSFLMNSVVYELGGSIAVKTGNHFLNVRRANASELNEYLRQKYDGKKKPTKKEEFRDDYIYIANFKSFDETNPEFCGNMITARIPIKYKDFNVPI